VTATKEEILSEYISSITEKTDTYKNWITSARYLLNVHRDLGRLYEAHDILHDILLKMCEGERTWEKEKYPHFGSHMMWIIKSHIDNIHHKESKTVRRNYAPVAEERIQAGHGNSPDAQYLEAEFLKQCRARLRDDELCRIFEYVYHGWKNKEIAEEMSIPVRTVENLKKRMKRKLTGLRLW
jgi:RNA polymerase sigma factor (sigma-70 family)